MLRLKLSIVIATMLWLSVPNMAPGATASSWPAWTFTGSFSEAQLSCTWHLQRSEGSLAIMDSVLYEGGDYSYDFRAQSWDAFGPSSFSAGTRVGPVQLDVDQSSESTETVELKINLSAMRGRLLAGCAIQGGVVENASLIIDGEVIEPRLQPSDGFKAFRLEDLQGVAAGVTPGLDVGGAATADFQAGPLTMGLVWPETGQDCLSIGAAAAKCAGPGRWPILSVIPTAETTPAHLEILTSVSERRFVFWLFSIQPS